MSDPVVLVTGASGYVGGLAVRRFRDAGALVVTHSRGPIGALAGADAVESVTGDLSDSDPFAGLPDDLRRRITHVVHSGAVTRFDVDADLARSVNVEGTAKVVALARAFPRLESFGLVSTVYATGLRSGPVAEQLYDDVPGFANLYEQSKWQSEELVASAGDDLPWRILRVATVVADDDSGRVTQHNAFHETLKLWFHGLLPLVPGKADTPLYLVTGDFVGDALLTLMDPAGPGGVFHLTHDAARSLTLSGALDVVSDAFEADDSFHRRRVLRPLLGDEEAFDLLAGGVSSFGGGLVRHALQSVVPFARQLFVGKHLDTSRARAALGACSPPEPAELVRRTCEHLVATRWGRDAVA